MTYLTMKRATVGSRRSLFGLSISSSVRLSRQWAATVLLVGLVLFAASRPVQAHDPTLPPEQILGALGFDQRLNQTVPLQLEWQDEQGQVVRLGDYLTDKPVLLVLGYFNCPDLCPLTRTALVTSLRQLAFTVGQEFIVVNVSIDPAETPALAQAEKQRQLQLYQRPDSAVGWHFLTGSHAAIDKLAAAVGFRYAYDTRQRRYAHAAGAVILTPSGTIARYLLGINFAERDLRLGLVEAAAQRIGTPMDRVLLFCYRYDSSTGQYTLGIMKVLRLVAGVSVLGMVSGVLFFLKKENDQSSPPRAGWRVPQSPG